MQVVKKFVTFLNEINIGRLGYVIELGRSGLDEDEKELAEEASQYSSVLITSENDIFKFFNQDLVKFMRELAKLSLQTEVIIYTNGYTKPKNLTSFKNIKYIVFLPNESSLLVQHEDNIKFFKKHNGTFVFNASVKEELSNIIKTISEYSIPFKNVMINIIKNHDKMMPEVFKNGFSVFVSVEAKLFGGK